ncbi:hypothetical protein B0T14DRAFT_518781 [Immersiella caudata]|uniref:Uncharacterized protein n=1 Tax=Immersiella caudata TaxID=314043 RepID=A0AA39WPH5_9PEZI|nr:hypothetical protein B0T14DRAFT_518781 [Immersiella caudata]
MPRSGPLAEGTRPVASRFSISSYLYRVLCPNISVADTPAGPMSSTSDHHEAPHGWFAGVLNSIPLPSMFRSADTDEKRRRRRSRRGTDQKQPTLKQEVASLKGALEEKEDFERALRQEIDALGDNLREEDTQRKYLSDQVFAWQQYSGSQKAEIDRQGATIRNQQQQIQALRQGQDLRSFSETTGPAHDRMQQRLNRLRPRIQTWSRSLLGKAARVPAHQLATSEHVPRPSYEVIFGQICDGSTTWGDIERSKLTVCDIIVAIASNIVVELGICHPLGPCTQQMHHGFSSMLWDTMFASRDSGTQHRKAAKQWQAACLRMYNSSRGVTSSLGTAEEKSNIAEGFIQGTCLAVSQTLQPILDVVLGDGNRNVFDSGENLEKLRDIVAEAVDIGRNLGELRADLIIMNNRWFQHRSDPDGFISPSDLGARIDPRFSAEEEESQAICRAKVGIVLFPGLLKYGNDDGERWDSWTVWTPAKVQLIRVEAEGMSADQGCGLRKSLSFSRSRSASPYISASS